jgi:hypothetical protein
MVHGGGFEMGSANDFDANAIAAVFGSRGVVVVTLNYRLGMFGMMATADGLLKGNYGLVDVHCVCVHTHAQPSTIKSPPCNGCSARSTTSAAIRKR